MAAESFMQCPECHRGELRRTGRKGFLEQNLYGRFGYYPWRCPVCRHRMLVKNRGQRATDRTNTDRPNSEGGWSRQD
jgi:hypothetical protein